MGGVQELGISTHMEIPGTRTPLAERDTLFGPAPRCIVNTNETTCS